MNAPLSFVENNFPWLLCGGLVSFAAIFLFYWLIFNYQENKRLQKLTSFECACLYSFVGLLALSFVATCSFAVMAFVGMLIHIIRFASH